MNMQFRQSSRINCELRQGAMPYGLLSSIGSMLRGMFRNNTAETPVHPKPSLSGINPTGEALTPERLVAFKGLSHLTQEQAERITHTIRQLARLIHRTANPKAI